MPQLRFLPVADLDPVRDRGARILFGSEKAPTESYEQLVENQRAPKQIVGLRREGGVIVVEHPEHDQAHGSSGWLLLEPAEGTVSSAGVPIDLDLDEVIDPSLGFERRGIRVPAGTRYLSTEPGRVGRHVSTANLVVDGSWRGIQGAKHERVVIPGMLAVPMPGGHEHFYEWTRTAVVANDGHVYGGQKLRDAVWEAFLVFDGDLRDRWWRAQDDYFGESILPRPKPPGPRKILTYPTVAFVGDAEQWTQHAAWVGLWNPVVIGEPTKPSFIVGGDAAVQFAVEHPHLVAGVVAVDAAPAEVNAPVLWVHGELEPGGYPNDDEVFAAPNLGRGYAVERPVQLTARILDFVRRTSSL